MATNFWLSLPAHPISGSMTVFQGTVPWVVSGDINATIDAFTKTPPDNALAVGTEDGTLTGIKHVIEVDANKNLHVLNMGQLVPEIFDEIDITNATIASQVVPSVVVYKSLGSSVATLTLTYDVDANITKVVRT